MEARINSTKPVTLAIITTHSILTTVTHLHKSQLNNIFMFAPDTSPGIAICIKQSIINRDWPTHRRLLKAIHTNDPKDLSDALLMHDLFQVFDSSHAKSHHSNN